jgi:hypothetical protein
VNIFSFTDELLGEDGSAELELGATEELLGAAVFEEEYTTELELCLVDELDLAVTDELELGLS